MTTLHYIEYIKKERTDLEDAILELVKLFETRTSMQVDGVTLVRVSAIGSLNSNVTAGIQVDVTLPTP